MDEILLNKKTLIIIVSVILIGFITTLLSLNLSARIHFTNGNKLLNEGNYVLAEKEFLTAEAKPLHINFLAGFNKSELKDKLSKVFASLGDQEKSWQYLTESILADMNFLDVNIFNINIIKEWLLSPSTLVLIVMVGMYYLGRRDSMTKRYKIRFSRKVLLG